MVKLLSVVVSVYNEELALREFYQETGAVLKALPPSWDYELLFVNDGSADRSLEILRELARRDDRVRVVEFSRNFGHEAAMIAGIDYARGDGIVCMDADLQHPPECLLEIVEKFDQGYEVISMVRMKNKTAGLVKNITSAAFYKLIMRSAFLSGISTCFQVVSQTMGQVPHVLLTHPPLAFPTSSPK